MTQLLSGMIEHEEAIQTGIMLGLLFIAGLVTATKFEATLTKGIVFGALTAIILISPVNSVFASSESEIGETVGSNYESMYNAGYYDSMELPEGETYESMIEKTMVHFEQGSMVFTEYSNYICDRMRAGQQLPSYIDNTDRPENDITFEAFINYCGGV